MPVKPSPAVPRPAATLVLLRDRPGGGCETLLIRRHEKSRFAAGDFVFPGGRIEPEDAPADVARWCRGLDDATAAGRLGLDAPAALAYWIAAIREAFEEVGVLLACDTAGRPASLDPARLAERRRACQRDHRAFWTLLREENLVLPVDRLVYFAHWVTPEERPLRFDTRFFAAQAPAGQDAEPDAHEITEVRWLTPAAALAARARGEISLRLPTATNLALFDGAPAAAAALERLAGREVAMIRPRLVADGAAQRTLLPGQAGWY
ncbi:MAG TPA: NUDIX hydrolase [Methylomirabilota bacterium]|nr:NUDIX hydrolase [Methylomirabilota bacterium]